MAEIKLPENTVSTQSSTGKRRLASLDIFRGLTVVLMVLVDDAGGVWPELAHAHWEGCNLADFAMPFFLFIVGVSVALAFKRISNKFEACKKVGFRTCKLLFWGLLLQGGFSHTPDELTYGVDMKKMFLPLKWIDMNAMLVYVMGAERILAAFFNGWYYRHPHNTLLNWIRGHDFDSSNKSKTQIQANVLNRKEAFVRRERAMIL